MIQRREFLTLLGSAAAWPLAARAQQGDRMRRIGVLMSLDENDPEVKPRLSAFTQALAELGWTNGRNMRINLRWYGGDNNRSRAFAQELVGLQPDIIVTTGTPATVALQRETRTIPIVVAGVTDPVAQHIVARLDRPGGNITGFADLGEAPLGGKYLELLSEIAPGLKRAAIMFNPDTAPVSAFMPSLETAARSLKVEPIIAPVHDEVEIEMAIISIGREPGRGLVVLPDVFSQEHDHIGGGPKQRTGGLWVLLLYQRRRFALLRSRPGRHLAPLRHLCRSHPARREAGRSPGAASDQVRDGREPQDRHGARSCHTAIDSAARG
jgi:putative ABC transport system substrate-binding protein